MTCLLDLGADLNAQDADGVTAIMLACKGKNFEVIELLQKRGARLDIKDNVLSSLCYLFSFFLN